MDAIGRLEGVRMPAEDVVRGDILGPLTTRAGFDFVVRKGQRSLWVVASRAGHDLLAVRCGYSRADLHRVERSERDDAIVFEWTSSFGAMRTKITFPARDRAVVRCTTSVLPLDDVVVDEWPRDLYCMADEGTVHTSQRGLRTGIVFASTDSPQPFSLFYLQDFSSAGDYFAQVERPPADTVGGRWPELGYAPPSGDACRLARARETIVSDAYVTISDQIPSTDGEAAAHYLDRLADVYLCLPLPETTYHDWPSRASQALRDLSCSPACTYVRDGRRFLMPYVADETKPPESMVQLTLAANTGEYDRWREQTSTFAAAMRASAPSFFDEKIGSVVRWLPGADFGASQAEENMNHEAMDSWYLHHALFNLSRLASEGDERAKDVFRRSLPFAMRVARRFAYRWPIFFNVTNLDVIRAEAAPGKGGETDVGGLYALVMLHALELFGDAEYLDEAMSGVRSLRGFGFRLAYQLNTTGFAAEAAMRLWKKTGEREFLELSEICMANLFDNMWLWQCRYGRARDYKTFFGLFPLRDAPYLAAYEELEAQGKFHDYLDLGGEDVRPSLRVLLAEYQRYALDRAWSYYPDTLPAESLAAEPRNGRVERSLSVPLEDLQDGFEPSGQVGQELYGAGLPFVYATRHYKRIPSAKCFVYCDYPMYDFQEKSAGGNPEVTWRIGGDARLTCEFRVVPADADTPAATVSVTMLAGATRTRLDGRLTPEGHLAFRARGAHVLEVRWIPAGAKRESPIVGAMPVDDR